MLVPLRDVPREERHLLYCSNLSGPPRAKHRTDRRARPLPFAARIVELRSAPRGVAPSTTASTIRYV